MADLSSPMMTPVGVVYRAFFPTAAHALKGAQFWCKLFGGEASELFLTANRKGFFEAVVEAKIPPGTQNVKPRKDVDESWMANPARAQVLFTDLEQPRALYFFEHELLYRPELCRDAGLIRQGEGRGDRSGREDWHVGSLCSARFQGCCAILRPVSLSKNSFCRVIPFHGA